MKKLILLVSLLATLNQVFAQDKSEEKKEQDKKKTTSQNSTPADINEDLSKIAQASMIYNSLQNSTMNAGNTAPMRTYDLRYEGTKGTGYFINDWLPGQVTYMNGNAGTKNISLKYDTYKKELLLKRPQGDSIIIYPNQISAFTIVDQNSNVAYPFVKVDKLKAETGVVPVSFLMVLYKGKSSLHKYVSKRILKADYQGAYSVDRRYDSFIDNSEYFIQKPDNSLVKVKIKKSSVLDILEDKKDQLEAYIKKENLSFKNDIDVAKVLAYYDTL